MLLAVIDTLCIIHHFIFSTILKLTNKSRTGNILRMYYFTIAVATEQTALHRINDQLLINSKFIIMKTIKKLMSILVLAIILVMTSCQNEGLIEDSSDVSVLKDFEQSIMKKAGPELGTQILERMTNPSSNAMKAAIVYNGELCPDVVNTGEAVANGYNLFSNADFWYFTGEAGDVVDIEVDRVNCNMDPIMVLFEGFGDDESLVSVAGADDNDAPACASDCFAFADPTLTGFVLPTTGIYTVAVWDWFSGFCVTGPLTYNITVTGQSPCVIVIDGCDTGIDNQTLENGSTMQGVIDACAAAAINHGDFVSCVAHATNEWKGAGLISGKEKGVIQSCAAGSNIPSEE